MCIAHDVNAMESYARGQYIISTHEAKHKQRDVARFISLEHISSRVSQVHAGRKRVRPNCDQVAK